MLREMIEKMVGRKMVVPRDFTWLSQKVEERTQQRVSASTLRRFWGYVSEGVSASKFTKDVLAKFLGYRETVDLGSWHQKIPDCRKMIPLNAITLLTMNRLIFMPGNMEMRNLSLMP